MVTRTKLITESLGVVANDILEDDLYIDVYPSEMHPSMFPNKQDIAGDMLEVKNLAGDITKLSNKSGFTIRAKWMPDGDTNRLEPPTVCSGETVRLYKYGDSKQYYWNTVYNQLDLRKLEKRTIVVSNKQDMVSPEELLNHTYRMTMDTINKLVELVTSDTDGEYTTYNIAIDTADGKFELTDGKGNNILLESQDDRLTVSIIKEIILNTTDYTANISNDHVLNIDNDKIVNVGNNRTDDIGSDDTLNVGGNKNVDVKNRYDIKVSKFTVDNGADELIEVLMDFVQASSDAIGIGNVGIPVPTDDATKSAYAALKDRLNGFK